jgi:hypothetical protein
MELWANNAETILVKAIGIADTQIIISDASSFPNPGLGEFFYVTLQYGKIIEILKCTSRNGRELNVDRAQQGTAAKTFPTGTQVEIRLTAATLASAYVLGGEANTASSLGGESLVGTKDGVDLRFKGLTAGANITLTPGPNSIEIAATGGVTLDTNQTITGTKTISGTRLNISREGGVAAAVGINWGMGANTLGLAATLGTAASPYDIGTSAIEPMLQVQRFQKSGGSLAVFHTQRAANAAGGRADEYAMVGYVLNFDPYVQNTHGLRAYARTEVAGVGFSTHYGGWIQAERMAANARVVGAQIDSINSGGADAATHDADANSCIGLAIVASGEGAAARKSSVGLTFQNGTNGANTKFFDGIYFNGGRYASDSADIDSVHTAAINLSRLSTTPKQMLMAPGGRVAVRNTANNANLDRWYCDDNGTVFTANTYRDGVEVGECGVGGSTVAGSFIGVWVPFKHRRLSVPTVTLSAHGHASAVDVNISSVGVDYVTTHGFRFYIQVNAGNQNSQAYRTYTTSA